MTANEVSESVAKGILKVYPLANIRKIPLADGGEGTIDALISGLHGEWIKTTAHDPRMKQISSTYGWIEDRKTAIIEMAKISGIELLSQDEKDPRITTTYGTGELILHALNRGCRNFIIGIGGSATNDGGAGMLQALGARLLDESGQPLKKGGLALSQLQVLDLSGLDERLNDCQISVACDVTNPLLGEGGATYTFGPQKGGSPQILDELEAALQHYAVHLESSTNRKIVDLPGAGAAGGLGSGLMALPNTVLQSGFDIIQEFLDLKSHIQWADIIFTGEGKIDHQTQYGKVPAGLARLAKPYNKPVIGLAGSVGSQTALLHDIGLTAIFSILPSPMSLEEAIKNGSQYIEQTSEQIMRIYNSKNS
ncbi:glycerate kinase [Membranihabitans marinus]